MMTIPALERIRWRVLSSRSLLFLVPNIQCSVRK
jgi:hypothetical protein